MQTLTASCAAAPPSSSCVHRGSFQFTARAAAAAAAYMANFLQRTAALPGFSVIINLFQKPSTRSRTPDPAVQIVVDFTAVGEQHLVRVLHGPGRFAPSMNGAYARNGTNRHFQPTAGHHHLFDSVRMVHATHVSNGAADTYARRPWAKLQAAVVTLLVATMFITAMFHHRYDPLVTIFCVFLAMQFYVALYIRRRLRAHYNHARQLCSSLGHAAVASGVILSAISIYGFSLVIPLLQAIVAWLLVPVPVAYCLYIIIVVLPIEEEEEEKEAARVQAQVNGVMPPV